MATNEVDRCDLVILKSTHEGLTFSDFKPFQDHDFMILWETHLVVNPDELWKS